MATTDRTRKDRTMTTTATAGTAVPSTSAVRSRRLLACGIVAAPLYVAVVLAQALTRDGFDLTRHPASLLANGDLGWIQTTNFVVSGALSILAAVGLRSALTGRGRTWAPRLLAMYGVGLLLAATFPADPAAGFPVGTPADYAEISSRGVGHFVAGTIGFSGLIAACFVMAAHFRSIGRTAWARYSTATGALFTASFVGLMAGAGKPVTIVGFGVAVLIGWTWIAAVCLQFRR
jgi:Protein of unknown function (DUF998)